MFRFLVVLLCLMVFLPGPVSAKGHGKGRVKGLLSKVLHPLQNFKERRGEGRGAGDCAQGSCATVPGPVVGPIPDMALVRLTGTITATYPYQENTAVILKTDTEMYELVLTATHQKQVAQWVNSRQKPVIRVTVNGTVVNPPRRYLPQLRVESFQVH